MNFGKIVNKYIWLNLPGTLLALLFIKPLPAAALDSFNANDYTDLYTDITQANQDGGATITITSNITLGGFLPVINSNISFLGNGNTISGNNNYENFYVNSGTVSLSNLTITQGLAQGGGGGFNGGGGGAGLGGGLFINAGSVTLNNVTFSGNQAVGGGGGVKSGGAPPSGGGGGSLNGNRFYGTSGGSGGGGTFGPGGNGEGRMDSNGNFVSGAYGGDVLGNGLNLNGWNGGFGGGGGGGLGGGGGNGGFGGGGGGGSFGGSGFNGGNGGFGGGGGGGGDSGNSGGNGGVGGNGGFGGGNGANGILGMIGYHPNGDPFRYGTVSAGGGGAGLGGAIFVNSGASLTLDATSSFINNSATGGASGGYGATNGQGLGGAIFIASGATVTSLGGLPSFSSNTASTSNNDYYGTITIDNNAPVPVPEPLTILGTITGASFGVAMRRRFVRS